MADPGFPVGGGRGPRTGGRGPLRWLRFENFACQNERIWTRRGGARLAPPLDPPMNMYLRIDPNWIPYIVNKSTPDKAIPP